MNGYIIAVKSGEQSELHACMKSRINESILSKPIFWESSLKINTCRVETGYDVIYGKLTQQLLAPQGVQMFLGVYQYTVFTRLQPPSELTPTSSRGLDMKEKSAIKRLSRIEAWSTKTLKFTQIEA